MSQDYNDWEAAQHSELRIAVKFEGKEIDTQTLTHPLRSRRLCGDFSVPTQPQSRRGLRGGAEKKPNAPMSFVLRTQIRLRSRNVYRPGESNYAKTFRTSIAPGGNYDDF